MVNPKSFRPWNTEQTLLLPPSPVDWLPEDHLVFFLLDLAAELELDAIYAVYRQKDLRGEKAYDPRMMVVLLLYAYCVGMPSSRKIEKACWEDAAFRVLTGNQQPDHIPRADSKSQQASGWGCRRAIASSAVMSCITACNPDRIDRNPARRNRFKAAVRSVAMTPAPLPR